jgi:hypothetical protein
MPIAPFTEQSWLFVPPLDLPLALRLANGRFGALRPAPLPGPPPCASGQVIPAADPRNPTGADVHFANQLHEAVDLEAAPGDCVFAAYSGRVVDVEANPAAARGNVTIDHHPERLGFVTKYNHITDITVGVGDFVQKGMPFAQVSDEPTEPHLHFELWAAVDRAGGRTPPGDSDLVPVDPTRALYAWEQRTLPGEPVVGGPSAPRSVGLVQLDAVPFFIATFEGAATTVVHVPMYEPMTTDERLAVELLRHAHAADVEVLVSARPSPFWGVDVVTEVELT